jgi:hypothetical protein
MNYDNLDIPAKLFFKICSTGELGEITQDNWDKIFDEAYQLRKNAEAREAIYKRQRIAVLTLQANIIQDALFALTKLGKYREARDRIIEILKKLQVHIKSETMYDDILRALKVKIGGIKNRIRLEELGMKTDTEKIGATYEEICVNIENVLERTIDENLTMYKFIAYEKSRDAKIKAYQKRKKK